MKPTLPPLPATPTTLPPHSPANHLPTLDSHIGSAKTSADSGLGQTLPAIPTEDQISTERTTPTDLIEQLKKDIANIKLDNSLRPNSYEALATRLKFIDEYRIHHKNPQVVSQLVPIMLGLKQQDPILQSLAQECLRDSPHATVINAFKLLACLSELGNLAAEASPNPEKVKLELEELEKLALYPMLLIKMLQALGDGHPSTKYIAPVIGKSNIPNLLGKSEIPNVQAKVRAILVESINTNGKWIKSADAKSFSPYALNPQDRSSVNLLIAIVETSPSTKKDFEASALQVLGQSNLTIARNFVKNCFYRLIGEKTINFSQALNTAMHNVTDVEDRSILRRLLIDPASVIIEQQGYQGLQKLVATLSLKLSNEHLLLNKKAEVILVLAEWIRKMEDCPFKETECNFIKSEIARLLKSSIFTSRYSKYNAYLVKEMEKLAKELSKD